MKIQNFFNIVKKIIFEKLWDGLQPACLPEKGRKIAFIMPYRDDGSDTRTAQFFWLLDTYLPVFIKQKTRVQFFIINQGEKIL